LRYCQRQSNVANSQMQLGIDQNRTFVYEGHGGRAHAIWPSPIIVPAVFASSKTASLEASDGTLGPNTFVFREDSFDPVSRIRRGTFYKAGDTQPLDWQVYPHPALPHEAKQAYILKHLGKTLYTFYQYRLAGELDTAGGAQPIVLLGTKNRFTLWTIVSIETIASKDELVVMRARQSFGALPETRQEQIPSRGRDNVWSALRTLQEDILTAGPESVIDRSREAATVILSVFLQEHGKVRPGLDLNDLLSALRKLPKHEQKNIVADAADIVRLFHSRAKHAVKEKLALRSIREQDAELAVQCVGTILCELGWGEWQ
jgi:hypothetical protein